MWAPIWPIFVLTNSSFQNGLALLAIRSAGGAAGHAQCESAPRSQRHRRFIGTSKADDFAGADHAARLEHFCCAHKVAGATLVVGPPTRCLPIERSSQVVVVVGRRSSLRFRHERSSCGCLVSLRAAESAARSASLPRSVRRLDAWTARPTARMSIEPLNNGSTKNGAPS
jgi:hypothetical protein